jgi:hypothetical protein
VQNYKNIAVCYFEASSNIFFCFLVDDWIFARYNSIKEQFKQKGGE